MYVHYTLYMYACARVCVHLDLLDFVCSHSMFYVCDVHSSCFLKYLENMEKKPEFFHTPTINLNKRMNC